MARAAAMARRTVRQRRQEKPLSANPESSFKRALGIDISAAVTQQQTTRLLATAGLVHRAIGLPVSLAAGYAIVGWPATPYLIMLAIIGLANAVLAVMAILGRLHEVALSPWVFAGDVCVMLLMNWAAVVVIPKGAFLGSGYDLLHLYTLGTVVIWTSVKGVRAAILIIGLVIIEECCLAYENGSHIEGAGITLLLGRMAWLVAAVAVPVFMRKYATRATEKTHREGERAGWILERARALRTIHDTVLQTFGQIVQRTGQNSQAELLLADIGDLADKQAQSISDALMRADEGLTRTLIGGLRSAVDELRSRGASISVQFGSVPVDLPAGAVNALVGAAREALTNAVKHSEASRIEMTCLSSASDVEIVIRDDGRGFATDGPYEGFGIEHSIRRRMAEIGGDAKLESSPGNGATIRLSLNLGRQASWVEARMLGDTEILADTEIKIGPSFSVSPNGLVVRAMSWFAIPALLYRVCISPIQVIFAVSVLGVAWSRPLIFAAAALFIVDLVFLIGTARGPLAAALGSAIFFAADVSVTAAMNLWTAAELPHGAALLPGREVFWTYGLGVIALWTGLRGARVGASLVAAGGLLQIAMLVLNHVPLTPHVWIQLCAGIGLLAMDLGVVWIITVLARQAAQAAVGRGLQLGRESVRINELRDIDAKALDALYRISRIVEAERDDPESAIRRVRGLALPQVDFIRAALRGEGGDDLEGRIAGQLTKIKNEFQLQGLRVELVIAQLASDLPQAQWDALSAGLRKALTNVLQHSGVLHAVVRASDCADGLEIIVRDQGSGFDRESESSFSSLRPLADSLRSENISMEVDSDLGRGTRVRFLAYRRAAASPRAGLVSTRSKRA